MRKSIAIITIITILLSIFNTMVLSSGNPLLTVSSETAIEGEEVSVNITISDNPGIAAYAVKINFDKNKITPVSISGDGIVSNIQQSNIDINSIDFITATWSSESNSTVDGKLFTIVFKTKEGYIGNTDLILSYSEGDICNQNLDDVNPEVKNGILTINKEAPTVMPTVEPTATPTPKPTPTVEPTATPITEQIIYSDNIVEVTLSGIKQAILIHSSYAEGKLISIDIIPIKFTNSIAIIHKTDIKNGDKLMVWDSINSMKPLVNTYTISR